MNKNFKRALSSVLASVIAFSSITVATVSSTLPFTAVQVFADSNFNVASSSATFSDYTGSAVPYSEVDEVVTPTGAANVLTALAAGSPSFINYTSATAVTKEYMSDPATEGPLAGTVFTKAVVPYKSVKAKDLYTISGIKQGEKIGIYFAFVDSKGATGKTGNLTLIAGTATATAEATADNKATYQRAPGYVEVTADADCTAIVNAGTAATGVRVAILGFTVTSAETTTVTTTEATTVATTAEATTEATTAADKWNIRADNTPSKGELGGKVLFYNAGDLVLDNDLATVYAGQNLTAGGKTRADEPAFSNSFRTNNVNTSIEGASYRICFKIITKASTRISAIGAGGSKNAMFLVNDDGTYTRLTPNTGNNVVFYADVEEAGKTVVIANGGTNDSMFGVSIQKGPTPVTVSTKFTLGNSAAAIPIGSTVTVNGESAVVAENGFVTFEGKTGTDYTVSYVNTAGERFEGTMSVSLEGAFESTVNLPLVSSDTSVTVKTADGTAVAGKKVTLLYYDRGVRPVLTSAVTDDAGVATFHGLDFESYTVAVGGYTSATTEFTPVEGAASLTINDATPKAYPALPAGASNDNLYVGYAPNATVTTTYDSVQDAVDAATAGQNIYLASHEYFEPVYIDKSVNIIGDAAAATLDMATITFNDSQSGNDSTKGDGTTDKVRFHGDTVEITATNATVTFKNIRIENTAEADLGVAQNATALGSYGTGHSNVITLDDCVIDATRDTIYTGSRETTNTWTFNNCTIAGFQDVVCGCGTVDINDCTWSVNMDNDARFLVPNASSTEPTVMTANNLTVVDATGAFTKKAFLGRIWGDSNGTILNTQVVINGFTDESGIVPFADTTYFHGYDTSGANGDRDGKTLADCNWLVRQNVADNFYTTNATVDKTAINTLQPITVDADGDYVFTGVVNSALARATETSYIGFAIYAADGTFIGNTKNDTVYHVTGEADDVLYSVNYMQNMPAEGCTVKGFVQYNGVNLTNDLSDATVSTVTAE